MFPSIFFLGKTATDTTFHIFFKDNDDGTQVTDNNIFWYYLGPDSSQCITIKNNEFTSIPYDSSFIQKNGKELRLYNNNNNNNNNFWRVINEKVFFIVATNNTDQFFCFPFDPQLGFLPPFITSFPSILDTDTLFIQNIDTIDDVEDLFMQENNWTPLEPDQQDQEQVQVPDTPVFDLKQEFDRIWNEYTTICRSNIINITCLLKDPLDQTAKAEAAQDYVKLNEYFKQLQLTKKNYYDIFNNYSLTHSHYDFIYTINCLINENVKELQKELETETQNGEPDFPHIKKYSKHIYIYFAAIFNAIQLMVHSDSFKSMITNTYTFDKQLINISFNIGKRKIFNDLNFMNSDAEKFNTLTDSVVQLRNKYINDYIVFIEQFILLSNPDDNNTTITSLLNNLKSVSNSVFINIKNSIPNTENFYLDNNTAMDFNPDIVSHFKTHIFDKINDDTLLNYTRQILRTAIPICNTMLETILNLTCTHNQILILLAQSFDKTIQSRFSSFYHLNKCSHPENIQHNFVRIPIINKFNLETPYFNNCGQNEAAEQSETPQETPAEAPQPAPPAPAKPANTVEGVNPAPNAVPQPANTVNAVNLSEQQAAAEKAEEGTAVENSDATPQPPAAGPTAEGEAAVENSDANAEDDAPAQGDAAATPQPPAAGPTAEGEAAVENSDANAAAKGQFGKQLAANILKSTVITDLVKTGISVIHNSREKPQQPKQLTNKYNKKEYTALIGGTSSILSFYKKQENLVDLLKGTREDNNTIFFPKLIKERLVKIELTNNDKQYIFNTIQNQNKIYNQQFVNYYDELHYKKEKEKEKYTQILYDTDKLKNIYDLIYFDIDKDIELIIRINVNDDILKIVFKKKEKQKEEKIETLATYYCTYAGFIYWIKTINPDVSDSTRYH